MMYPWGLLKVFLPSHSQYPSLGFLWILWTDYSILFPEIHPPHSYPGISHILSLPCSSRFWDLSVIHIVNPVSFATNPSLLQAGLILSCPEKCTFSILSMIESIHYFADVPSMLLTLYILLLLPRMHLHSRICLVKFYTSLRALLKCHLLHWVFPDSLLRS